MKKIYSNNIDCNTRVLYFQILIQRYNNDTKPENEIIVVFFTSKNQNKI